MTEKEIVEWISEKANTLFYGRHPRRDEPDDDAELRMLSTYARAITRTIVVDCPIAQLTPEALDALCAASWSAWSVRFQNIVTSADAGCIPKAWAQIARGVEDRFGPTTSQAWRDGVG